MGRRYRDKIKVVKVIESCTTLEQLRVAARVIWEYNRTYNICSDLLDYTHYKHTCKLLEEKSHEA